MVLSPSSTLNELLIESCEPDIAGISPEKYHDLPAEQFHSIQRQEVSVAKEGCSIENTRPIGTAMDAVRLISNAAAIASTGEAPGVQLFQEHRFKTEKST